MKIALAVALAVAGLAFGAAGTSTNVTVHMHDWFFTLSQDSAPAGTVVFAVVNDGGQPHDFSLSGHGVAGGTPVLQPGKSATLTIDFKESAQYAYASAIDDVDREMNGIFTVTGTPATTTAGATTGVASSLSTPQLRHVEDVPLPGDSSRFDYQSLDQKRNTLYIAHLGAGRVLAFGVRRRVVTADIGDVAGAHGVLAVPSLGLVYAAAADSRELVTIRERDAKIVARAPAGVYPDGIAFEPRGRAVFVSDKLGRALLVFDARTGRRTASIALGGEAGNVQYDSSSRRIYVADGTHNTVAAIDPARKRVVARIRLPGCDGAHGVNLDTTRRLAFVTCEGNAKLVVVDLVGRRVTARFTVGEGPDVLAFDTAQRRLYVAAESGVVAVFVERGRGLRMLGRSFLATGAHTVAVDSRTHLVYFPLADVGGKPVLRIMRAVSG